MRVRTDNMLPPTFQLIWSNSCSTKGSTPVTHNTTVPHANQEMVRSNTRTKGAWVKATCNTLTPKRITAREIHTGSKMANKGAGCCCVNTVRATKVKTNSSTGNSTPSTSLRPNKMANSCAWNTRRTPQVINQAINKQTAKASKAIKDSGR
jgi:hypothetical protein